MFKKIACFNRPQTYLFVLTPWSMVRRACRWRCFNRPQTYLFVLTGGQAFSLAKSVIVSIVLRRISSYSHL